MLNRFHPVYHSYTYLAGSRIDIDRVLEARLDTEDPEELIDQVSEPPQFFERLSPVTTTIGEQEIKGRNWTDMMIKCYRSFGKIFTRVTSFLRQSLQNDFGESTMVPFMSIAVDPDTLVRLIEHDYEAGENSYPKLIELFENGVVSPAITTPFHAILPLAERDFDRRLLVRLGMEFFVPVLRAYERYLKRIGENSMVVPFWAPDAHLDHDTMRVVHEEFYAMCAREKFESPHLVYLANADEAKGLSLDRLMKLWCRPKLGSKTLDDASVVFRDLAFSNWMMTSHPSLKKIIDRTIAKVDGRLNEEGVDYGWAHFESLEALTFSARDAVHFEQRILKLCELSYLSVSPDTYVRRKRLGRFGTHSSEPVGVAVDNLRPKTDPWGEASVYGRYRGWGLDKNKNPKVMPNEAYARKLPRGTQKCQGSPSWKIAWNLTRERCLEAVGGSPDKMNDGMLGVLASLAGTRKKDAAAKAVEDFLVEYGLVYWREHFIQHDLSEADIRLDEIFSRTLRKGSRKKVKVEEVVVAGLAAQAYFFLLDSSNSYALDAPNMDQRALFQNVVMLSHAFCNAVAVYTYLGDKKRADAMVDVMERELMDFESAFERYDLKDYGVSKTAWNRAIASEIDETKLNVVARAARRTAARHLGDLGYGERFGEEDEEIPTNVGHHWNAEVNTPNYKWANPHFCGVKDA